MLNEQLTQTLAAAATGLFVLLVVFAICRSLFGRRNDHPERGSFEKARLDGLRRKDATFRLFEPWVEEFAALNRSLSPRRLEQLDKVIQNATEDVRWRPDEYIGTRQVEGTLLGLGLAGVGYWVTGSFLLSVMVIPLTAYGLGEIMLMTLRSQTTRKVFEIKRRLSFAIDLMALMMEAGAGFRDTMEVVSRENADHPFGAELAKCSHQLQHGRTISEVLKDLGEKIQDEDVSDFVYAMVKGNELGTPLSRILRTQAEQMRLRRSQWAEKDAAQAQVKIIFPGMIIMIACLLIVMGQFMLPAIFEMTGS